MILRVNEHQTSADTPRDRVPRRPFGNVVAWQPDRVDGFILAIGTPDQWHSSDPLPEGTVVTNLVETSLREPRVADRLWGPFLRYVYHAYTLEEPRMSRIIMKCRADFWGIPVSVSIGDETLTAAVKQAIKNSRYQMFKVL